MFVRQRWKHDCGVAALAMLCNVNYEEAREAIPWYVNKKGYAIRKGTTTRMMRVGAKELGFLGRGTNLKRLSPFKILSEFWVHIPDNSLVRVPDPDSRNWHWVVWKNYKIYDPARGVFKSDDYHYQPSRYMEFVICMR